MPHFFLVANTGQICLKKYGNGFAEIFPCFKCSLSFSWRKYFQVYELVCTWSTFQKKNGSFLWAQIIAILPANFFHPTMFAQSILSANLIHQKTVLRALSESFIFKSDFLRLYYWLRNSLAFCTFGCNLSNWSACTSTVCRHIHAPILFQAPVEQVNQTIAVNNNSQCLQWWWWYSNKQAS
jgi:hypothetical protein